MTGVNMFEKEAEEYKDNTRIKDKNTYIGFPDECISEVQDYEGNYIDISERIIKTFKDGAEFGYNKAKEEMQKNGLVLQSDMDKTIEQNISLKEQIEKMKCCEMCKHKNLNWGFSPICEARDNIKIENPLTCKCDKWEIKENEKKKND